MVSFYPPKRKFQGVACCIKCPEVKEGRSRQLLMCIVIWRLVVTLIEVISVMR